MKNEFSTIYAVLKNWFLHLSL